MTANNSIITAEEDALFFPKAACIKIHTLQQFCAGDERPAIAQPWSAEQWSYASDGRILLRVPRVSNVPANPLAPKIHPPAFTFRAQSDNWQPMPEYKYTPDICPKCAGRGTYLKCPSCHGRRVVDNEPCPDCTDISTAYMDDALICMICEGYGLLNANSQVVLLADDHTKLNCRYLHLIQTHLTSIEFMPEAHNHRVLFRYLGGMGYLTTMR